MSSYLSLLGISTIDNVQGNNINVQNVTTNSITVSNLTPGLVSANASSTLQNAIIGTGLDYNTRNNTLQNTGVTSIIAGFTGPISLTNSTGDIEISLPQNIRPTSDVTFNSLTTDSFIQMNALIGADGLMISGGGSLATLSELRAPLIYNPATYSLRVALTGSTGIDYTVRGNTGYITNKNITGTTGPQGIQGLTGYTGPQGIQGFTGPQGIQGLTGYTGPVGLTGPSGLITSNFNVFGGVNAGILRTTATGNVGLGYNALSSLTTSINNTAVGTDALKSISNSTPINGNNTAIGYASLTSCASTGVQNTAIGAFSGYQLTTGRFNTLMGMAAGFSITSGYTNFCLGLNSGYNISRSNDNISIGAYSMARNLNLMTGPDGRNVGIGHYAAHNLSGYPQNNIAIGYQSLYNATQCSDNIAIGTNSLNSLTTGGGNIAIGGSSTSTASTLTNGQGLNIGLGLASNLYITNGSVNNIGIGGYSNFNTSTGCNNIAIGQYTQQLSATGCNSIIISTKGTSGTPISGKGDNTAFIDARSGLFTYSPAFIMVVPVGQTNGVIQWQIFNSLNRSMSLQSGDNTRILCPYIGLYEFNLSGSAACNGSPNAINSIVNGSTYISSGVYEQGGGWTSIGFTSFVNVTSVNTYVQYSMSGSIVIQSSPPLICTAKFISL